MADDNKQGVEAQVKEAFDSLVQAVLDLDFDCYANHMDREALVVLNTDGSVFPSFDAFAGTYRPGFEAIEEIVSLEFPVVEIRVIDSNTALLANEFRQTVRLSSGDTHDLKGGGLQVWSRRSGTWKLTGIAASGR